MSRFTVLLIAFAALQVLGHDLPPVSPLTADARQFWGKLHALNDAYEDETRDASPEEQRRALKPLLKLRETTLDLARKAAGGDPAASRDLELLVGSKVAPLLVHLQKTIDKLTVKHGERFAYDNLGATRLWNLQSAILQSSKFALIEGRIKEIYEAVGKKPPVRNQQNDPTGSQYRLTLLKEAEQRIDEIADPKNADAFFPPLKRELKPLKVPPRMGRK